MIFSSNEFIFIFLPSALIFYFLCHTFFPRARLPLLIFMSLVFYTNWRWSYTIIIIFSIISNYVLHLYIYQTRSYALFMIGVIGNLTLLIYFKYAFFIAESILGLSPDWTDQLDIVLPLGISFFTFQQIAFLSDVYRGQTPAQSLTRYALFVTFFPQLIAGPIVHDKEMMHQFNKTMDRDRLYTYLGLGFCLFIIGLLKKVIIADKLAVLVGPVFAAAELGHEIHLIRAWTGTLAYTFQLYFDFSAYSDMAMGLALMFGVRLPSNFNSPYKARSIIEFWRRWHITLSRFLKNYVYIPLGGNRQGVQATCLNLLITMTIGGIWHGAGWTFLLWGLFHGLLLVINHLWILLPGRLSRFLSPTGAWALTFLAVVVGWVLFRAPSLESALIMYKGMFDLTMLQLPLELKPLIERLGMDGLFAGMAYFAENDRRQFYLGLLWIMAAGSLAFWGPNSLQIMRRFDVATNMQEVRQEWAGAPRQTAVGQLAFQGRRIEAVIMGVALAAVILALNSAPTGEFLYFEF